MESYDKEIIVSRIGDIIEQIEALNRMIDLHKNHDGDASTILQYETIREQFVLELGNLLKAFRLGVTLVLPAA